MHHLLLPLLACKVLALTHLEPVSPLLHPNPLAYFLFLLLRPNINSQAGNALKEPGPTLRSRKKYCLLQKENGPKRSNLFTGSVPPLEANGYKPPLSSAAKGRAVILCRKGGGLALWAGVAMCMLRPPGVKGRRI